VSGIGAVHYSLRHVNSRAGHVRPPVYVYQPTHWPAVDAHSDLQARMSLERATDLYRAMRRFFGTLVKDQCHPVATGDF
jgi:hypothetical protein